MAHTQSRHRHTLCLFYLSFIAHDFNLLTISMRRSWTCMILMHIHVVCWRVHDVTVIKVLRIVQHVMLFVGWYSICMIQCYMQAPAMACACNWGHAVWAGDKLVWVPHVLQTQEHCVSGHTHLDLDPTDLLALGSASELCAVVCCCVSVCGVCWCVLVLWCVLCVISVCSVLTHSSTQDEDMTLTHCSTHETKRHDSWEKHVQVCADIVCRNWVLALDPEYWYTLCPKIRYKFKMLVQKSSIDFCMKFVPEL